MQLQGPNGTDKGENKLFQNALFLMCYCSFEIGQFQTLKAQSERHAIELFKVQISPDHPKSNTNKRGVFYGHIRFCELYSAFNGFSHYKLFAIYF